MTVLILEPLEAEVVQWLAERHDARFAPELVGDPEGLMEALQDSRALVAPPEVRIDTQLLRRVQRLVAEEYDLALGQQPAQRVRMVMHLRRVREIDAVYLRSYARGDVFDLHEIPFL